MKIASGTTGVLGPGELRLGQIRPVQPVQPRSAQVSPGQPRTAQDNSVVFHIEFDIFDCQLKFVVILVMH